LISRTMNGRDRISKSVNQESGYLLINN
jgi:hypothetical protein